MNADCKTIHGRLYDYVITESISLGTYYGKLKVRGDLGQIDPGISVEITTQKKNSHSLIEMVAFEGINYNVYPYNKDEVPSPIDQEWIMLGDHKYRGDLKEGIPHGNGEIKWSDCSHYSGNWSHGRMSGFGIMTWPSGKRYEGAWENSQMEGEGTMFYPNGSIYTGKFHQDKREGHGVLRQPNGEYFEGEFVGDKPSSEGGFYTKDGQKRTPKIKKQSNPSLGMRIWQKTWRLWAGLACFALAVCFAELVGDFFSGKGPSRMRVDGIFLPIILAVSGVKLISGFLKNLFSK